MEMRRHFWPMQVRCLPKMEVGMASASVAPESIMQGRKSYSKDNNRPWNMYMASARFGVPREASRKC